MKTTLLTSALSILGLLLFTQSSSQVAPTTDQNPNYNSSRDKYMRIADSINQWHKTTLHEPYKAYDWYEQRLERHEENRRFHQSLQLEWARNPRVYPYHHYYNDDHNRYHYRNRYYDNRHYHRYDNYRHYPRQRYYPYGHSFRFQFCW